MEAVSLRRGQQYPGRCDQSCTRTKAQNGRGPALRLRSVEGWANQLSPLFWRKRVGVEPTGDGVTRRPPVLKTGTITGPHALPKICRGSTRISTDKNYIHIRVHPRESAAMILLLANLSAYCGCFVVRRYGLIVL